MLRYSQARHYPAMIAAWRHYGWPPCPPGGLPRYGLVAETDDGAFVAYLGMYLDDGRMGFVDWALKDPASPRDESDRALRALFGCMVRHARESRCAFLYSMTKTVPWGKKLESYGMQVAEQNATTYIMALKGAETAFISD